jgi:hypothetical protein
MPYKGLLEVLKTEAEATWERVCGQYLTAPTAYLICREIGYNVNRYLLDFRYVISYCLNNKTIDWKTNIKPGSL